MINTKIFFQINRLGLADPTPPGSYYTNIDEFWVYAVNPVTFAYNYDNPTDYVIDNLYDSRMFAKRKYYNGQWLSNYSYCLNPTEMNFYANGTIWVMNNYVSAGGARPAGKSIITINLFGQVYYEDIPYYTKEIISHAGIFKYGILHMGNEN